MCFAFPLEMKGHYDEKPELWISVSFTFISTTETTLF